VRYFTHRVQDSPGWKGSIRFAVVRNPFDLLVSMYSARWPYGGELDPYRFPDFPAFVRAWCDPDFPWLIPDQHRSLYFQLSDDDGDCPLDHLLHQERLDEELEGLCNPLGIQPVRGSLHKASRFGEYRDHRSWYTDALREQVEAKAGPDLRWLGYDFDGIVPGVPNAA
jgi:hypothetical protein